MVASVFETVEQTLGQDVFAVVSSTTRWRACVIVVILPLSNPHTPPQFNCVFLVLLIEPHDHEYNRNPSRRVIAVAPAAGGGWCWWSTMEPSDHVHLRFPLPNQKAANRSRTDLFFLFKLSTNKQRATR